MLLIPCLRRVLRPSRTLASRLGSGRRSERFHPLAPSLLSCRSSAASPRLYGTHSAKEPVEPLNTVQGARDFVYSLHSKERKSLLQELQRFESMAIAQASPGHRYPRAQIPISRKWREQAAAGDAEEMEVKPPSSAQRRYVFLHSAIPFVGFGFLDNAIMIVAGTQIELSIGVIFGISTMAAAALGNLVSDVAGLGLAGYVEALASRLGLPSPDLNPKQADMWQTRLSSQLGKVIGVTIGCILGMFPLIFFKTEEEEKLEESKN
ncbi:transmembrane protein 65 isoform X1 [Carcharodon carcharias]|uniref:transmembrane protein 65 isoform X1 n=1 Tax=Carcharodon carcharias TaxID=13397 RepID=UPI001B7E9594|nr:transmembrane protein 65 isoform X1 [Carcharodon carcharias]